MFEQPTYVTVSGNTDDTPWVETVEVDEASTVTVSGVARGPADGDGLGAKVAGAHTRSFPFEQVTGIEFGALTVEAVAAVARRLSRHEREQLIEEVRIG